MNGKMNSDGEQELYINGKLTLDSNVVSRNLFDKNNVLYKLTYTATGGTTQLDNSFVQYVYIPVKPNTKYTISTTNDYTSETDYRLIVCEYDSNKTFIQRNINIGVISSSLITSANTHYVRLCASTVTIDELQFEEGDKTDYVPYLNLEEAMQENEVYSTSERRIGTWIDGKTLYRKVSTGKTTSEMIRGSVKIADIPSEMNIKRFEVTLSNDLDKATVMGSTWFSDTDYVYVFINGRSELRCKVANNAYINRNLYAIVEYTKTTD